MWQWVIHKSTGSSNESTEYSVLAFRGGQLRDVHVDLYCEATNRHGCWAEACCENMSESPTPVSFKQTLLPTSLQEVLPTQ